MKKDSGILIYLIIGLIGSMFFIYFGYLLAGAVGVGEIEGIGFSNGIFAVLSNPFKGYFNDYTPIFMILGFILFECVFAIFLFSRKKEEPVNMDEYKPDILDLVDLDNMLDLVDKVEDESADEDRRISEKKKRRNLPSDSEIFNRPAKRSSNVAEDNTSDRAFVSMADTTDKKEEEDKKPADNLPDPSLSFGSEIMEEMLGDHYELDQLLAMLSIKKYMSDVTADVLKRMFSPDMTPEEITSYIQLFYE